MIVAVVRRDVNQILQVSCLTEISGGIRRTPNTNKLLFSECLEAGYAYLTIVLFLLFFIVSFKNFANCVINSFTDVLDALLRLNISNGMA